MDRTKLIWLGTIVGGAVGGYLPLLWGTSAFSISSIIFSGIGSIVGIYLGFKLGD